MKDYREGEMSLNGVLMSGIGDLIVNGRIGGCSAG